MASHYPVHPERTIPRDRPPTTDMPPLELFILDELAQLPESVHSMGTACSEGETAGLAGVGEAYIFGAIRTALAKGWIEVEEEYVVDGTEIIMRRPQHRLPRATRISSATGSSRRPRERRSTRRVAPNSRRISTSSPRTNVEALP